MGTLKQTLPWGDEGSGGESTIIASIFDAMVPHAGAGMAVVVGDHQKEITQALSGQAFAVVKSATDGQQYESICRGLDYFVNDTAVDFALLQPADHPFVSSRVIAVLFEQAIKLDQPLALIPTYQGKGGHPAFIPRLVAERILAWSQALGLEALPSGFQGLKTFWKQHSELVERIEIDEPSMIIDLDTPEDYERARS